MSPPSGVASLGQSFALYHVEVRVRRNLPNGDKRPRGTFAGVRAHFPNLESDDAIFERKDRIVTCQFGTSTNKELAPTLSHDNIASFNQLTAVPLNTQSFTLGIATVFCRAFGFC